MITCPSPPLLLDVASWDYAHRFALETFRPEMEREYVITSFLIYGGRVHAHVHV